MGGTGCMGLKGQTFETLLLETGIPIEGKRMWFDDMNTTAPFSTPICCYFTGEVEREATTIVPIEQWRKGTPSGIGRMTQHRTSTRA
jgi:hypothetical protein